MSSHRATPVTGLSLCVDETGMRLWEIVTELRMVSVEAGSTFGWERYADVCVGIDRFGASAPGSEVLDRLGISVANIKNSVLSLVSQR